ncbi:MAG: hypothetical protein ACE5OZ_21765 [Candidatus Heimdallarchaeota archaeon]
MSRRRRSKYSRRGGYSKSSGSRSAEITRQEFDEVMDKFGGMPFKPRGTSEIVYNIPIPQMNELSVWVYSTIHHKSGKSRKTGSDAIRTIMLYQGKGVMKEPKTLRTANWARNVEKKVKTLLSYATEYRCPWGHPLVIRHRKEGSGTFYGCAFFPECQYIYRGKKPPSSSYVTGHLFPPLKSQ